MRILSRGVSIAPALCFVLLLATCTAATVLTPGYCTDTSAQEPKGLMLSWQQDPTTTMTIDWHPHVDDAALPALCYKKAGETTWTAQLSAERSTFSSAEQTILRAELTGLQPGTDYVFQVGEYGRAYAFRTMPEEIDTRPLVFAAGGDLMALPDIMAETHKKVMQYDLDFVMWGGDLAYANGEVNGGGLLRWQWWFEANLKHLVTETGRVIPIIVGIGNHEVLEGYYSNHENYAQTDAFRLAIAPNFYRLFAFPGQPGYAALDFGNYLTLVVLDTDHTNPIEGQQTAWLKQVLTERQEKNVAHIFPLYHVPAYPSHRSYDNSISIGIREHWVPLFEEHGVRMAFENHDHTYKRTRPMLAGAVDPAGIVYMGDGAWGVGTREENLQNNWYVEKFASEQHGIIVTLQGSQRHVKAISAKGAVLDEFGD
jgi:acid phosphatase type 7